MKIPEWLPDTRHPIKNEPLSHHRHVEGAVRSSIEFLKRGGVGGVLLLICTMLALALANSSISEYYAEFWEIPLGLRIGGFVIQHTLRDWINDGLMTLFFFVAGLEIKREVVLGELGEPRKAALPIAAALGGMIVPVICYLLIDRTGPGTRGWGIPMATDIAFVVGFLSLLGSRVPFELRILLLTLAIVDDIGAVIVIALAYTSHTSMLDFGFGLGGFFLILVTRWLGVRALSIYVILGTLVWFAFLRSGIHPTVAGVVLGLMTPTTPWFDKSSLLRVTEGTFTQLQIDRENSDVDHHEEAVYLLKRTAIETVSPLDRLESQLHPWLTFVVMPLFALANAGVVITPSEVYDPITLAVAIGLIVGKPFGIVLFSWVAVALGLATLPKTINWRIMFGAGCLAGIGFTMSLFIAGLALPDEQLSAGKIGTLIGSSSSAVLGLGLLYIFLTRQSEPTT